MFVESLIFVRAPQQSLLMVFGSSAVRPSIESLAFIAQAFHADFKRRISVFAFKLPAWSGF